MADYDVGVVSLTTPTPVAPLAQCRPVVSIRNNGIHDAIASGYLRIYSAGLLVFVTECYSDTIGPGETRPASAVDYWTPDHEGRYMVQGYFKCPLDQVELNNNLWPTTVIISGVEPPPPTPVPLHASQHESGGADETSIEGLPGRAGDAQLPINHASFHENAGIDRIDVTGLPGVLGAAQNPKPHAAAHKVSGSDPLDVLALPNATQLELVARKGAANGYAPLDSLALVPFLQIAQGHILPVSDNNVLRADRFFGPGRHCTIGDNAMLRWSLIPDPNFNTIHSINVPQGWIDDDMILLINIWAVMSLSDGGSLELRLMSGASSWGTISIPGHADPERHCRISATIIGAPLDYYTGNLAYTDDSQVSHIHTERLLVKSLAVAQPATDKVFSLVARLTGGIADLLTISGAFARSISAIPS